MKGSRRQTPITLAPCIALLLLMASSARGVPAAGLADSLARVNLPFILESWESRMERNGGVHPWQRSHAGMRVFQEWIALLSRARDAPDEEKRRMGRRLKAYVVDADIRALGFVGTSLPLPGYDRGDFDMTLLGAVSLLGLFERDTLLLPNPVFVHLIRKVIRLWGQTPKEYFDLFFLSFPETENHFFMSESSRYLSNQFIRENTRGLPELKALRDSLVSAGVVLDNERGMLRRLLLKMMHRIMRNGFFEFNARVYQRFTIHALDNVYSFARDEALATASGCLLDYLSALFAFQSIDFHRYPPYRRSSERYLDSSLIAGDAACSFFAAQGLSGNALPAWQGLWLSRPAHASTALFSALLAYRVPDAVLDYMRGKRADFMAESVLRFSTGSRWQSARQLYFSSPFCLLSAGGRYHPYEGHNFPTYKLGMGEAPWVYDIISRPTSVLVAPARLRPRRLEDVLHFGGNQWKDNNLAVHGNFAYGYARSRRPFSDWPQSLPPGWRPVREARAGAFDLRFYDLSAHGLYVVLGRLRQKPGLLGGILERFSRGTIELVDTGRVATLDSLRSLLAERNAGSRQPGRRLIYVTADGHRMHLDPRYGPRTPGLIRVESPPSAADPGLFVRLPFRFPWIEPEEPGGYAPFRLHAMPWPSPLPEGAARPLMVTRVHPSRELVAYSDGRGNMFVNNPWNGTHLRVNFTEWWNPRRGQGRRPPLQAAPN